MGPSFKDAETDRLAREVARLTGESLTQAVRTALAERLDRERRRRAGGESIIERLDDLAPECATAPDIGPRSADEIIGYDDYGVPR